MQSAISNPHSFSDTRRSLTDQAYRRLEEMIATLKLKPGAVLSETQLVDALKIGRTPIREALQRLTAEGMVEILPRKGILVSEINPQKQLLLLEVRREVDRLAQGVDETLVVEAIEKFRRNLLDDIGCRIAQ